MGELGREVAARRPERDDRGHGAAARLAATDERRRGIGAGGAATGDLLDGRAHAGAEGGDVPLLGVDADRRVIQLRGIERAHRRLQRIGGLPSKNRPVSPSTTCVGRAATAVGDDRRTAGHRLDRHEAEVVLAREDQGAAALHEVDHLGVALLAEERDVGRGAAPELVECGTVAGDDQRQAETAEGLDRHADALVGLDEPSDDQEEVLALASAWLKSSQSIGAPITCGVRP